MSAAPASAREHSAALLIRLQAVPALVTYRGEAPPGAEPPYAILDYRPGRVEPGSLADRYSQSEQIFAIRAVGRTEEQALWVADLARTTLLTDAVVVVSGRTSMPITQESQGSVLRDDDVSPSLYVATIVYRWTTT